MSPFASTIAKKRYMHPGEQTWADVGRRVGSTVLAAAPCALPTNLVPAVVDAISSRKFMPGGRYLGATGKLFHQTQNCLLLRPVDTREGWGTHLNHVTLASMTGAGLGGCYSLLRERGAKLGRTGGIASGPVPLMLATNEVGRAAMQGGDRRAALWAGLHWWHPDVLEFIHAKDWAPEVRAMKARDFSAPAPLDQTNISVCLDDEFFAAYADPGHRRHDLAQRVYWTALRRMLETGEPGFSVDVGVNAGEWNRNACTEVTSYDDSDICNLGSINMARVESLDEMRHLVEIGTAFLLAGTLYSDVPYGKVAAVRDVNRRLGLGLMGLHEWLLQRGYEYGSCPELECYLDVYAESTDVAARWARDWGINAPVKTRAIAPTGTIGIVAETTTGIEPIFCVAYRRRYHERGAWHVQYVVDPTAQRLINAGTRPEDVEDAYTLAAAPERRVAFQAWVQQYVDHGISSTLNLPPWGSALNNEDRVRQFGDMLFRRLPRLRGVTVYPDGARDGQPLTPCSYSEAAANVGQVIVEQADVCVISKGGEGCGA
jgi:ribonucleoside-diphosphate reductase alpha chain